MLLTQCSLLVGFAFESLVHLDVPEDTPEWIASWYFISLSAALMFGVYVVVTGSCLVVLGHLHPRVQHTVRAESSVRAQHGRAGGCRSERGSAGEERDRPHLG